jgi:hypothetical protein
MLKKSINMPPKNEVKRFHAYLDKEIARLSDNYSCWSSSEYRLLRDLLITELTIFNGRRGGEPARLLLHQWEDAYNDEWIRCEPADELEGKERMQMREMKIAYQRGKGGQSVPVIFLEHIVKVMKKFCSHDVRRSYGVNEENRYVFQPQEILRIVLMVGMPCTTLYRRLAFQKTVPNYSRQLNATFCQHLICRNKCTRKV